MPINKDFAQGKWKEFKGELRKRWGELTENELEATRGNLVAIVGLLQQKAGLAKGEAQKKVDELVQTLGGSRAAVKDAVIAKAGEVVGKANAALEQVKGRLKKG